MLKTIRRVHSSILPLCYVMVITDFAIVSTCERELQYDSSIGV